MGQEGLDSGYRVLSKKKAILCSEIGLWQCLEPASNAGLLLWILQSGLQLTIALGKKYMRSELMLMLPHCTILLDICTACDVLLENLAVLRGSCHPSSFQTCLGEQIRNCPHFNLLTIYTFATSHFNNFF